MKVLIIDRGAPIPVTKYGGTERVIWGLGYELYKQNHQVFFLVKKGSYCNFAKVIEFENENEIESLIPKDIDVIHFNFVPDFTVNIPHIITMHGNAEFNKDLPLNTVFISKNHANRHSSEVFVYNGLNWNDYPSVNLNKPRILFHFLGKGSWKVKNLSGANKIAVKAKQKLAVLGSSKFKFYNFKRSPFYSLHPNIKYMGMTDNETKVKIMEESKGLIFPVLWDEPFGLALIESFYCGCAIFGTKRGSLSEIVTSQVGFLSNEPNDLVEAVKTMNFDPLVCHNYAKENFNSLTMTNNYLKLYNLVIAGENLNTNIPKRIK